MVSALVSVCFLPAPQRAARFLRFDEVREVLDFFAGSGLPGSSAKEAAEWDAWVRRHDRQVRSRIDRGIEDSISNLILFGTSFTELPRLEGAEHATSEGGRLTQAALARVRAFAGATTRAGNNERLLFARDFLLRRGVSDRTVENFLSENLRRCSVEQRAYQEKLRTAQESKDRAEVLSTRGTLFERRGLSVDTSLLPNLAVEDTLRALKEKQVLPAASIRRIAVVGPGLDFTDKRDGYDFYPPQTLQPFALLEAVLRLNLADPENIEVVTLDLNPTVNAHLEGALRRAQSRQEYTMQLPRDTAARWTPQAQSYWSRLGEIIGSTIAPAPVPTVLQGLELRAISVQPRFVLRLRPIDVDIVAETIDPPEGRGFDLVVATNVLLYYNRFEQALAMTSVAHMMNKGAVFIANQALPAQHPRALEYLGRRSVSYSTAGEFGDDVVAYRRIS